MYFDLCGWFLGFEQRLSDSIIIKLLLKTIIKKTIIKQTIILKKLKTIIL